MLSLHKMCDDQANANANHDLVSVYEICGELPITYYLLDRDLADTYGSNGSYNNDNTDDHFGV